MMKVILASASPRRRQLLEQIGWEFEVMVSDVEEKVTDTDPQRMVEELSRQKAEAVLLSLPDTREELLVVGADTVVALEGRILGKPADRKEAADMLRMLQGGSHHVYTGVTLLWRHAAAETEHTRAGSGEETEYVPAKSSEKAGPQGVVIVETRTFCESTLVSFHPMSEQEIAWYTSGDEPLDKAGAYGIQGLCARYIRGIEGDYNNVVGLPVGRLYQEVKRLTGADNMEKSGAVKSGAAKSCAEESCSMRENNSVDCGCGKGKKAVIFDLDGTLSDSLASIKYCADQAVAPLGFGPFSTDQYRYFVGDGAANLIRRCLKAGGDGELEHFEEAFARYQEIFRENCMYQVKPYEGIRELLAALKERGVRIAVLSNKPHEETVHVIEALFGKEYFDVVRGQKPHVAIKPSPEGVFEILREMKLRAEEIVYLGDTCTDMQTGKNAKAFTVGALWGFRDRAELEENQADAIIAEPMELLSFV